MKIRAIGLLFVFTLSGTLHSQEAWEITGSAKTFLYTVGKDPLFGNEGGWILDAPIRLRAFTKPDDTFDFEAAFELDGQVQEGASGSSSSFLPSASPYRAWDFQNPVAGPALGNGARLLQNLDRFAFTFHKDDADLTLGRQVITFGSGRLVNPTDLLAPFHIQTRDQENRSGVDALRLRRSLGDLAGLDAGIVFGKDLLWENDAVFLRPHFRLAGADLSVMGMVFREDLLLGGDLQGSIGGVGVWAEGAWVRTHAPEASYTRLVLGGEYLFNGDLTGSLEYHFNGPGQEKATDYLALSNPEAYGAGTVYFLGRHYLCPSLSWQLDPLVTLMAQTVMNLGDGSLLPVLTLEFNAVQDFYLSAGALLPVGKEPNFLVPSSEFGLYPAFGYLSGRLYF